MTCSRVHDLLAAGRSAFGLWVGMADPAVVEMAAHAGYDYVNVDMEHQPLELATVVHLIRAAHACGISAMVRVPENNPSTVLRVADQGPDGIIVPHILDEAGARAAVRAVKFPPVGDRGISGSTRSARYGAGDFRENSARVNDRLLVWLLIEDTCAVDDIAAIAAVPGVDVCAPAPADLARAYGQMGTVDHPDVRQAVETVAKASREVGRQVALHLGHPNLPLDAATISGLGARLIDNGVAGPMLQDALIRRMAAARAELPQ